MTFSKYPTSLDDNSSLPKTVDLVTPVKAEVVNRLRDAIIASQTELGVDPSGTFGTVRARLDALSASLSVLTSGSVSTADLSEIISDLSDLESLTNSHISDTGNPHSVTAAQVGAPTTTDFTNHTTDTSNPHSVTAAQVNAPNRVVITTDEAVVRFDGMSGQMQDSSSGPFVDDNGRLRILESSDPTAATDSGYLYTKDVSGTTELFYIDSDGNITSLTEADGTAVTGSGADNTLVRWDGTGSIQDSGITVDDSDNISWEPTVTNPTLFQADDATASVTGDTFTIHAQDTTGATSTGGDLHLRPGTGTSTDGALELQDANGTARITINAGGTNTTINGSSNVDLTGNSSSVRIGSNSEILIIVGDNLSFHQTAVSNPTIRQKDDATISTTGDTLTIHAQNATGATSIGGDLTLNAGSGTSADGQVNIGNTNTTSINIGNFTNNPFSEFLGSGDVRLSSQIRFTERSGDPTNVANAGFVYTKDVGGVTELFYIDSDGNITSLTEADGTTVTGSGTDNALVRWDGTNSIQNSGITVDDSDNLTIIQDSAVVWSKAAHSSGAGTSLTIKGQDAFATSAGDGGDIIIRSGDPDGAGDDGEIFIARGSAGYDIVSSAGSSLIFGDTSSSGVSTTQLRADDTIQLTAAGSARFQVTSSQVQVRVADLAFLSSVASPIIRQEDDSAASAAGDALIIHAQNATGTTSTGGDLTLRAGSGTSADGNVNIGASNTASILVGNATDNPFSEFLGSGDVRLSSQIRFTERAGDPTNIANTGFVYTKDVSTVTQLFYEDSAGGVTQLTTAGGGTAVTGTGSDNTLVRWDGTNAVQSSGITVDDSDNASGFATVSIGASPATAGDIRMGSGGRIVGLDSGAANRNLLNWRVDDILEVGSSGASTQLSGSSSVNTYVGGSLAFSVTGIVDSKVPVAINSDAGTVATAGDIRGRNDFSLYVKTAGGTNTPIFNFDTSDNLVIGDTTNSANTYLRAAGNIFFQANGNNTRAHIDDDEMRLYVNTMRWDATTTPTITQITTSSGNGSNIVMAAQASTDTGSTGGDLVLRAGSGTSLNGDVRIGDANTNIVNVGTPLEINTGAGTVATTGDIRGVNGFSIVAKDAANSNTRIFEFDTSDELIVGNSTNVTNTYLDASTIIRTRISGVSTVDFSSSAINPRVNALRWVSTTTPAISHQDTASGNGATFSISAQNSTDAGSTGGTLSLVSGSGTSSDGDIRLIANGASVIRIRGSDSKIFLNNTIEIDTSNVEFAEIVSNPTIVQQSDNTASAVGDTFTIQAQSTTGTTSTGGDLTLRAGSGTSTDGDVNIGDTDTANVNIGTYLNLAEQGSDPTNVANTGFVYTKDVSTVTQLFYEDSAGGVTQLTTAGGGTAVTGTGVDNRIVRWNGTNAVQSSGVTVDDSDNASGFTTVSIGTDPASAGDIRLPASSSIAVRNTGNTADLTAIQYSGDTLVVGGLNAAANVQIRGTTSVASYIGSDQRFSVQSTLVSSLPNAFLIGSVAGTVATAGSIRGITGFSIYARNAADTGNVEVINKAAVNDNIEVGRSGAATVILGTSGIPTRVLDNQLRIGESVDSVAGNGSIRGINGFDIYARNSEDNTDCRLMVFSSSETLGLGGVGVDSIHLDVGATNVLRLTSSTINNSLPIQVNSDAGTVASTGDIRLSNEGSVQWRNAANDGDIQGIRVDANNHAIVGFTAEESRVYSSTGGLGVRVRDNIVEHHHVISIRPSGFGSDPASTGSIRHASGASSYVRDDGNTKDIHIWSHDPANDDFTIGDPSEQLNFDAFSRMDFDLNGSPKIVLLGTEMRLQTPFFKPNWNNTNATAAIGMRNADTIEWRDQGNANDIHGISINASDDLILGDSALNVLYSRAGTALQFQVAGSTVGLFDTDEMRLFVPNFRWTSTATSAVISHFPTTSGNGANMSITAQSSTEPGRTGGNLILTPGDADTAGEVIIEAANGSNMITVSSTRSLFNNDIHFDSSLALPNIIQLDETSAGVSGETLTIQAQNSTGTGTKQGGNLFLRAGASENGTDTGGSVLIAVGSGDGNVDGNVAFTGISSSEPDFQGMERGIFIADSSAVPTGNPTSGGYLWIESGSLWYRGSSGTITQIADA